MEKIAAETGVSTHQSDFLLTNYPNLVPQPAFLCDPNFNIVSFNPQLSNYLGHSPESSLDNIALTQMESLFGLNLREDCNPNILHCFSNLRGDLKYFNLHSNSFRVAESEYRFYLLEDYTEFNHTSEKLERKRSELSIFSQVVSVLGSSLSFNEILKIILIAVTAREGLGLNRAFLFLSDTAANQLQGYLAVGPSSPEEAGAIWNSLPNENKSLIEILKQYSTTLKMMDGELNRRIQDAILPLDDKNSTIREVIESGSAQIISSTNCHCEGACKLCQLFGMSEFAVVPMYSGKRILGIITADNCITARNISKDSLEQLQVFANQAAIAIERTRLYEKLSANVTELEQTNEKLHQVQDDLLKLERVSLWSELTYDIAHDLRNPASIIGGFAGLIKRSKDLPESLGEQAEIIYTECSRLEKALNDLLDFSKSFSQDDSTFCLRQLIQDVIELISTKSLIHDYRIEVDPGLETVVAGKRDQLKFILYSIITLFEERVPSPNCVKISLNSADNNIRVRFEICTDEESARNLISDFGNPRAGKLGLKVSMAFEAVKYNGGSLGIESRDGLKPGLYLECPTGRR